MSNDNSNYENTIYSLQENINELWSGIQAIRKGNYAVSAAAVNFSPPGSFSGLPINIYSSAENGGAYGFVAMTARASASNTVFRVRVISNKGQQTMLYPFNLDTSDETIALPFFLPLSKGWNELKVELYATAAITISANSLSILASVITI